AERARNRRQGKSDTLDAERIAREVLAHPNLPLAFKRSQQSAGPDQMGELLGLWHQARCSLQKSRQHLLNEAENLLHALPEAIRDRLPAGKHVEPRLRACATLTDEMSGEAWDAPTRLRLRLLDEHAHAISELSRREAKVCREMALLLRQSGSTLDQVCGISTRSAAELLVEGGDPRRLTEGGFARFNGSAPLPASSAEGDDEPVRHRLNRSGNRRVKCDPASDGGDPAPLRAASSSHLQRGSPTRAHQERGSAGPQAPPEQRRSSADDPRRSVSIGPRCSGLSPQEA